MQCKRVWWCPTTWGGSIVESVPIRRISVEFVFQHAGCNECVNSSVKGRWGTHRLSSVSWKLWSCTCLSFENSIDSLHEHWSLAFHKVRARSQTHTTDSFYWLPVSCRSSWFIMTFCCSNFTPPSVDVCLQWFSLYRTERTSTSSWRELSQLGRCCDRLQSSVLFTALQDVVLSPLGWR